MMTGSYLGAGIIASNPLKLLTAEISDEVKN